MMPSVPAHLLMAAVESAGEAIVITDLNARITYANPAFEEITGWNRNTAIGKNPRILNSGLNPPEIFDELWQAITNGVTWRGSLINRRRDGSLYKAQQTIAPVAENDELISVHRDVTEHDRIQRELRQATEDKLSAMEDQINLARSIQQKLYPTDSPNVEGFEVAGRTIPAEATCGDYFDYLTFSDGSRGFVVGDVSGHGLGPALLMAETRAFLRALCEIHHDPGEILARLNEFLVVDTESKRFVSLFLCCIDPDDSSSTYAAAGHAGFLIRANGDIESLGSTGLLLGLVPNEQYTTSAAIHLRSGDQLALATDGFSETCSPAGELWGTERFLNSIIRHRRASAETAIEDVYADAQFFAGSRPQADDMTLLLVRAL